MAWSSYFDRYNKSGDSDGAGSYPGAGSGDSLRRGGDPYGLIGSSVKTGPLMTSNDWTWAYGSPSDINRRADEAAGRSRGSYRSGGGGGGGISSQQSNETSTGNTIQTVRFTGEMPTIGETPTLAMPEVDKRRIRALTQQAAAPQVRTLREGLQGAMMTQTDNPNVRRMTVREALQGYGTGLEKVMAGAGGQARAEHQQELNLKSQEAQANFKAAYEKVMAEYQAKIQAYLASRVTETTTNQTSNKSGTTVRDGGGMESGFPTVVRRNVWGTPEIGPSFQAGYNMKIGRDPLYGITYR